MRRKHTPLSSQTHTHHFWSHTSALMQTTFCGETHKSAIHTHAYTHTHTHADRQTHQSTEYFHIHCLTHFWLIHANVSLISMSSVTSAKTNTQRNTHRLWMRSVHTEVESNYRKCGLFFFFTLITILDLSYAHQAISKNVNERRNEGLSFCHSTVHFLVPREELTVKLFWGFLRRRAPVAEKFLHQASLTCETACQKKPPRTQTC